MNYKELVEKLSALELGEAGPMPTVTKPSAAAKPAQYTADEIARVLSGEITQAQLDASRKTAQPQTAPVAPATPQGGQIPGAQPSLGPGAKSSAPPSIAPAGPQPPQKNTAVNDKSDIDSMIKALQTMRAPAQPAAPQPAIQSTTSQSVQQQQSVAQRDASMANQPKPGEPIAKESLLGHIVDELLKEESPTEKNARERREANQRQLDINAWQIYQALNGKDPAKKKAAEELLKSPNTQQEVKDYYQQFEQVRNRIFGNPSLTDHDAFIALSDGMRDNVLKALEQKSPEYKDYIRAQRELLDLRRKKRTQPETVRDEELARAANERAKLLQSIEDAKAKPNARPNARPSASSSSAPASSSSAPASAGSSTSSSSSSASAPASAGSSSSTATVTTSGSQGSNATASKEKVVTAAELNAFRTKVGNPNATLGQYLNSLKGLTAKKGGANDPEVIQSKLAADQTAYDPKKTTAVASASTSQEPKKDLRQEKATELGLDGRYDAEDNWRDVNNVVTHTWNLKTRNWDPVPVEKPIAPVELAQNRGVATASSGEPRTVALGRSAPNADGSAPTITVRDGPPRDSSEAGRGSLPPIENRSRRAEPEKSFLDRLASSLWVTDPRTGRGSINLTGRSQEELYPNNSVRTNAAVQVQPTLSGEAGRPQNESLNYKIDLSSVVSEIINETGATATAQPENKSIGQAVKDVIPQSVKDVASKVGSNPVVRKVAKYGGPAGAIYGAYNSVRDFDDADEAKAKGDKVGQWIKNAKGATNLALGASGAATLIPATWPVSIPADIALMIASGTLDAADWVNDQLNNAKKSGGTPTPISTDAMGNFTGMPESYNSIGTELNKIIELSQYKLGK